MLDPIYTNLFKKQFKLAGKRGLNLDELGNVMRMIINEQPLPAKYRNHPLHGNWKGCFECHIEPDWLLIYEPSNKNQKVREVVFHCTGSHSDLF